MNLKGENTDIDLKDTTHSKKAINAILAVVICLLIAMTVVFVLEEPPFYQVGDGNFYISTEFGQTVNLNDIETVELKNGLPAVGAGLNGFAIGQVYKGGFGSDTGNIKLYLVSLNPPFIYITAKNGKIILNDQSQSKTQSLYDELSSNLKK